MQKIRNGKDEKKIWKGGNILEDGWSQRFSLSCFFLFCHYELSLSTKESIFPNRKNEFLKNKPEKINLNLAILG